MSNLPISRIVKVDVNLSPLAAQAQDLSTLLVLGSSDVIDVTERLRDYETLDGVALDFGTALPEYLAAQLWFEQEPQPVKLKIGRWALNPTSGKLVCGALSANGKAIATWNAISNGGFNVSINGVPSSLNNLDFGASADLPGVAAVISAALAGAVCTYNSSFGRFEFESNSAGVGSSISVLSTGGGTDITDLLEGTLADGAYTANGIAAETAAASASLFDSEFGQTWYAMMVLGATDNDHLAVAAVIEGSNNKHVYGIATEEAGVLSSVSTTDIGFLTAAAKLKRTIVQYSSSLAYSVASFLGRLLTVNWNGNNTAITMKFKQEPGVVAESINASQAAAMETKFVNAFVAYNNGTAIVEQGTTAGGNFADEITGTDWLAVTIMTAVYNLLFTSPTKIPQTDAGMHLIKTVIESVCVQGVQNGLLAPGVWNSQGFGTLAQGDFLDKGFYVFQPAIASQLQADREARKSVVFQVAAKLAGAVHSVDIIINVNR